MCQQLCLDISVYWVQYTVRNMCSNPTLQATLFCVLGGSETFPASYDTVFLEKIKIPILHEIKRPHVLEKMVS